MTARLLVALALLAGCASETEREGLSMRVELDGEMQDVRADALCYIEDDGAWDAVIAPFLSRAGVEYQGQAYRQGGRVVVWLASEGATEHPTESDDPDTECLGINVDESTYDAVDVTVDGCVGDMVIEGPIRITDCRDYEDAVASGEID